MVLNANLNEDPTPPDCVVPIDPIDDTRAIAAPIDNQLTPSHDDENPWNRIRLSRMLFTLAGIVLSILELASLFRGDNSGGAIGAVVLFVASALILFCVWRKREPGQTSISKKVGRVLVFGEFLNFLYRFVALYVSQPSSHTNSTAGNVTASALPGM